MSAKRRLGFMFSNWYSGATLLAILLSNHESISCNGETYPFSAHEIGRYVCSCEKPLLECAFYRSVCSHMLVDGGIAWNEKLFVAVPRLSRIGPLNRVLNGVRYPYFLRRWLLGCLPASRNLARTFVEAHHQMIQSCCDREGSTLYIDGTKSIRRAELLVRDYRPLPKVIHLVRDGRGFCASYIKHSKLGEEALPRAARAWNQHIDFVETFLRRHRGVERLTLRYEDLCHDLGGAMGRIAAFFGISPSGPFVYRPGLEHHVLGNKMRKTWDGTVKEDRSWETKLSRQNLSVITGIMEEKMTAYGYL